MSSSSKSSTSTTQHYTSTTQDNRIAAEAGSVNLSQSDGNVINLTDAGAVGKSLDFAYAVSQGAASTAAASVGQMGETAKNAVDAVRDAYAGSAETIQDSYRNSNAEVNKAWQMAVGVVQESKAGEQKMLAFGVLAVVALAATKALGGR